MTTTKKLLILGVVLALLGGLFVFLPGTLKGSFLKSDAINDARKLTLPLSNSDLNNGYTKNPAVGINDAYNNIYIVDTGNHRIQKFDSAGKFLMKFGTEGSGDGQFISPQAMALDVYNNMYVVDTGNNRIQKFDTTGKLLMQFGTKGKGDKQFESPTGIIVDTYNNIYVVDTGNHRIQKFDTTGKLLMQFGTEGSGDGQFRSPGYIVKDPYNNIYVVDTGNHRIQKFDSTGKFLMKFGTEGSGDGQFKSPKSAVIDRFANFWIVDTGNNRIQRFTLDGKHQRIYDKEFPQEIYKPLPIKSPISLFFGAYNGYGSDAMYVISESDMVQGYVRLAGNYDIHGFSKHTFRRGFGVGQFSSGYPQATFILPDGGKLMIDTWYDRGAVVRSQLAQRFDVQGNLLKQFYVSGETFQVDAQGNLYTYVSVADVYGTSHVVKYDSNTGRELMLFYVTGQGNMVLKDDKILVIDNLSHQIVIDNLPQLTTTIYDLNGKNLYTIKHKSNSIINHVTRDIQGNMYLEDMLGYISMYDTKGTFVKKIKEPLSNYRSAAGSLDMDDKGNFYVLDVNLHDGNKKAIIVFDNEGKPLKRYPGYDVGYIRMMTRGDLGLYLDEATNTWYIPSSSNMRAEYPINYRFITEDDIELEAPKVEFIPAGSTKEITALPKTCAQKLEEYAPDRRRFVCENPQLEHGVNNYIPSEFRGGCTSAQSSCSVVMDGPKDVTVVYRLLPKVTKFQLPEMTRSLTVPILGIETNKAKIAGYMITEESYPIPKGDDSRWSTNKPTQYTFSKPMETYSAGRYSLSIWLKDTKGLITGTGQYYWSDSILQASTEYKPYRVSFGAGSGSNRYIQESINGTHQETVWRSASGAYPEGTNLSLKTIANYGYMFTGWSGDCAGTDEICTLTINDDKNITAKFEASARVSYALGNVIYEKKDVLLGQKVSVLPPPPQRDGYEFTGWYTSSSGGDEFTKDTIVAKDTYVYAQWRQKSLPVNGSCGTTNNSCTAGTLSDTTDSLTQYLWSCTGQGTGTTAQCTLNKPINGTCGSAAKTYPSITAAYAPDVQCTTGTPSNTKFPDIGASAVTWTCSGQYGGTTSPTCTASRTVAPINGACGTVNNICTTGTLSDTTDSSTQYLWSCTGQGTGTTAQCTLNKPINGTCGSAAKTYTSEEDYGSRTFCATGALQEPGTFGLMIVPQFPEPGTPVNWTCFGINSGANASCTASKTITPINGACGTVNNICTTGTLSDTTDSSTQYLWSCTGQGTGTTASCTLAKPVVTPVNGVCGTTNNTCTTGTLNDAPDSSTQYYWSCSGLNGGTISNCQLNKPILVPVLPSAPVLPPPPVVVVPPTPVLGPPPLAPTAIPAPLGSPIILASATTKLLGTTGAYTTQPTLSGTIACETGNRVIWYNGIVPVGQSLCVNSSASWSLPLGSTSDFIPLTFVTMNSAGNTSVRSAIFGVWYEHLSPPAAPKNLTSKAQINTQITLTWTAPINTGSAPLTDYILEYRGNGPLGGWRVYDEGVSTQTTATVSGISPGAYSFRVSAKNTIGTSGYSDTITVTIVRPPRQRVVTPPTPAAPTDIIATPMIGGVQLKFVAPTYTGTSPITDYIIEYKLSSSSTWKTFNDGVSTNLTATVNGLVAGKYNFRVSAKNTSGQGIASTIVSTTVVRGVRQRVVTPVQ